MINIIGCFEVIFHFTKSREAFRNLFGNVFKNITTEIQTPFQAQILSAIKK